MRRIERLWWGTARTDRAARAALTPLELLYSGVVAARGFLYDTGVLRSRIGALPALSIGNLSVGGTGKTPLAAWAAAELARRGAHPAIVLRGYGDDEPLVHAALNPDLPVVVSVDRVAGMDRARVLGADVAVLDDAFQHRRARRDADIVLVSAERWTARPRLLPAGPWREPLSALRRASHVVITRKSAGEDVAATARRELETIVRGVPISTVHLRPEALRSATGPETRALDTLDGAQVRAIAGIGNPEAFFEQLRATGARVAPSPWPDHHHFTSEEISRIALGAMTITDLVVCTLKDAVKLGPHWPRQAPPLWYVSQRVVVEDGAAALADLLDSLVAARGSHPSIAGGRRPT